MILKEISIIDSLTAEISLQGKYFSLMLFLHSHALGKETNTVLYEYVLILHQPNHLLSKRK